MFGLRVRVWNLVLVVLLSITVEAAVEPRISHAADGGGSTEHLVATPLKRSEKSANTDKLFRELPASETGIEAKLQLPDPIEFAQELLFLNPYGGIATGDFNGDDLADFYLPSPMGGGRLYQNLGGMKFRDVTVTSGLEDADFWGTGATFVDIDNDGDMDLHVCGYLRPNRLYVNEGADTDGNTKFVDRAKEYGLDYDGASMTMAFADIDNDGDLDGYLATTAKAPPPGTKFQVRFVDGKPYVLDHLKEYWELIYLPGGRAHRTEAGQYDHLFRNDDGHFVEITKEAGIDGPYFTLAATWWDYNNDNLPDLYVSNDYKGPDMLYENQGNGKFRNVIKEVLPHTPWFSMGTDLGDLDGDGLIDFLATDMSATSHYREKVMMGNMEDTNWFLDLAEPRQYMRNAVYLNSGTSRVMESAFMAGLASTDWTWTPRIADFDNDGRLDVYFTNGTLRDMMNADISQHATETFEDGSREWAEFWSVQPFNPETNHAYRNLGNMHFENVEQEWGLDRNGVTFGAATADFDLDGDLDIVVCQADAPVVVYENLESDRHRIVVRLRGKSSNSFGLGATVRIETDHGKQVHYVTQTRGYLSSCEPIVHFGLGDAETIKTLSVQWPSGKVQTFENLPADTNYTIHEAGTPDVAVAVNASRGTADAMFQPSRALARYKHVESEFNDFEEQPLLPNRLSRDGPAMATGDVDGDGRADVYLGGARGQAGQLITGGVVKGLFLRSQQSAFAEDADCEDIDATFFDADGDGDLDLYVVSGSNEAPVGDVTYGDRLYLNDGKGKFSRAAEGTLPALTDSGSSVAFADVDGDGDNDLFVGSRYVPRSYPTPGRSRLLINEQGKFVERTPESVKQAGLVADASFGDVNGDNQPDLLLAEEWGPVRVLLNDQGKFTDQTESAGLAKHLGWWTHVTALDVDNDGDLDFCVGNFGHNTKYKASHKKPALLYYGQFDETGDRHMIEAKLVGDTCLPRRGFSCSRNAMPFLKDKFKTFHNFASATLDELYTPQRLDEAQRLEANTLAIGVLINDGKGHFEFVALPPLAQISPCFDSAVADLNGDGVADLVLAQNFFAPQVETGRMDGGLGLVLLGRGDGHFDPVPAHESGWSRPSTPETSNWSTSTATARSTLSWPSTMAPW